MTANPEANFSETIARRLESVYSQLMTLLHRPDVARRLRTAPGNDEWSALQVLGHMAEMIPYWLGHCRTLIAAHEPPHFGRTLDAPERLAAFEPDTLKQPEALVSLLEAEMKKKPFPGFDTKKGHGDRERVFEAQLAASLWPCHIARSDQNPTLPDRSLIDFNSLKIVAVHCNDF